MEINYHKIDTKILQYDLESIEFKFGMWITKKEFGQRLNNNDPLPKGQFYMSVRVVSKDINTTEKIARRLIKQFTKLDIIRLISSSKNPKKGSIYEYLVQIKEGTVEDTVKTQLGHSKSNKIKGFEDDKGLSKGTIEGTVKGTSKNKIKSKEKIYIDLTFIDDVINKVKITQDQYDKLINKFNTELVNKQILELDNYIVNGKGTKYKDHYRVLNTWCNNKYKSINKSENIVNIEDYIQA